MFSINIPSFSVCRSKIDRGTIILEPPSEKRKIEIKKNINKTAPTNQNFLSKIQNYHKSWKRTKTSSSSSSSSPLISTLLYKYTEDTTKPNIVNDDQRLLIYIDLISDIFVEICVNDDLTTYEVLKSSKEKILISNLLLFTCPVCLEVRSVYLVQSCGHCLCKCCLEGLVAIMGPSKNICIVCRRKSEGYWMSV